MSTWAMQYLDDNLTAAQNLAQIRKDAGLFTVMNAFGMAVAYVALGVSVCLGRPLMNVTIPMIPGTPMVEELAQQAMARNPATPPIRA